jgi:hypothetical protein
MDKKGDDMGRLLLVFTALLSLIVCTTVACDCDEGEELPASSAIVTSSYSVKSSNLAYLQGEVRDMRGRTSVYVSMMVGTTVDCSDFETDQQPMHLKGYWTSIAAGLQPNTKYYFRAKGEYSGNPPEILYGEVGNFETGP